MGCRTAGRLASGSGPPAGPVARGGGLAQPACEPRLHAQQQRRRCSPEVHYRHAPAAAALRRAAVAATRVLVEPAGDFGAVHVTECHHRRLRGGTERAVQAAPLLAGVPVGGATTSSVADAARRGGGCSAAGAGTRQIVNPARQRGDSSTSSSCRIRISQIRSFDTALRAAPRMSARRGAHPARPSGTGNGCSDKRQQPQRRAGSR